MSRMLRHVGIASSLATLVFLSPIKTALFPSVGIRSWAVDVSFYEVSAVLCLVLLAVLVLMTLFTLRDTIQESRAKTEIRLLLILFVFASFGSLSFEAANWFHPIDHPIAYLALPTLVCIGTLVTALYVGFSIETWERVVMSFLLVLAPAAVVLNLQVVSHVLSAGPSIRNARDTAQTETAQASSAASQKIVWIVFDELDHAALSNLPDGITTPAFDSLMANAFIATNAYPPAQGTRESIASLIYGNIIEEHDPSFLESWTALNGRREKEYFRIDDTSLVDDIRGMRKNAGVLGWYIPYERLFGDDNTFGEWTWFREERCKSFVQCVSNSLDLAIGGLPIKNPFSAPFVLSNRQTWERRAADQRQRNIFMMSQAKKLLSENKYDASLIHLSVPHGPYAGTESTQGQPNYFNNIELADQNLAEILATVRGANGDNTTLIVTSDHWWRDKTPEDFSHLPESEGAAAFADSRVPFIVKLAGSDEKVAYDRPFNTVLLRRLINAILKGEIRSNAEVSDFISSDTERFPSDAAYRANRVQQPKSN